jgi:hypothetical protein
MPRQRAGRTLHMQAQAVIAHMKRECECRVISI